MGSKKFISTTKDGMLGNCGKARIRREEQNLGKRYHQLLAVLSRLAEAPEVFLEQTQEAIFIFGRKMLADQ